jgi:hypothetical protein
VPAGPSAARAKSTRKTAAPILASLRGHAHRKGAKMATLTQIVTADDDSRAVADSLRKILADG